MTPHKHAEVIKAWADGAEVQWRQDDGRPWKDINGPCFSNFFQYRVKPKGLITEDRCISLTSDKLGLRYRDDKDNVRFFFDPDTLKLIKVELIND